MGAPIAPLMAELFMTDFEEKNPASIRQNGVRFWCRYVDDTFVLLEKHVDPYIIAVLLSSFHLSLAFTFESKDENNSIPFLDVQITHSSPGFSTKVYRKSTFTSLLTRWDSYVPDIYKRNAIGTMVHRAIRICSSYKLLDEEFEKTMEIAGHNGYPNRYVDKIIWEKLDQYYTLKVREPTVLRERVVLKVPFYGQANIVYGRRVSTAVQNNFPLKEVKVVYETEKLDKCFNTKDKVPSPLESGIVYKGTCSVCNEFYIGKTYRHFCKRTKEHLSDQTKLIGIFEPTLVTPSLKATKHNTLTLSGKVSEMKDSSGNTSCSSQRITESHCVTRSQTGCLSRLWTTSTLELSIIEETVEQLCCIKNNNKRKYNSVYVAKSAIGKHYSNTGHVITDNNFEIVLREKQKYKLLVKESLVIRASLSMLNGTDRSVPLYVYSEGVKSNLWDRKRIPRKGVGG
ncbi:unnamed protein product [Didymodactylos carnosus]|uniref:Reverse transcriptase domain-containing protein n=1 Tax=Didymodactylos carnosus TaxID=1234261 RepID=A0A815KM95_9BILA|nr:unnamed protein product [Didymodactylos carnosus]CAF4286213.1 unnamed protein product [Didymodactylos carnosus]